MSDHSDSAENIDETLDEVRAELALLRQLVAYILVYTLPDSVWQEMDRKLAEYEAGGPSGSDSPLQRAAERMRKEIAVNNARIRASMK